MARIWISDVKTPFLQAFEEEWLMYDNGAIHDDTLDAVYMACIAGEGHMPSMAVRTQGRSEIKKKSNPYAALAMSSR